MASTPIEVVEGNVTVSGPEKVRAGDPIAASWTVAIHPRDYVAVVPAGAPDGE
ncbi:hypothetical protein [Pseudogemmobacter sonorensis]|uniref:hypothetical protein n=1 Tax=Pseudogemmobacter sonorensis TaxID=2989681 RepID=UPI0036D147F9